jgi:hypothetical protein
MRTIGSTLALLAIVAGTALAGVPRVINYQGRARTNNVPVTGKHQMTLKLYASQTGGTPLFSETQTVNFTNDGIFSVAIGDSSGGIPESVPFDQEYWLGVTISGVNGGAELAPRLTIRSSPYSIRSTNADHADHASQADQATTAQGLQTPATIGGSEAGPLLDVNNNGTIGVKGKGSEYGLVSIGPDSTSRYYVSGENLGTTGAPVPGATYRDNAPIAWGNIDSKGTIVTDFGIAQVIAVSTGVYEVILNNPVEPLPASNPTNAAFAPVITPNASTDGPNALVFPMWSYKPGATANPLSIIVYMRDINNRPINNGFSIVVFGRPQ